MVFALKIRLLWTLVPESNTIPTPARPALRHSLRAFIGPHASGVQTLLFTPSAFGKGRGRIERACKGTPPRPSPLLHKREGAKLQNRAPVNTICCSASQP